ncbi:MAG: D-alanyl-D-alanine carboxypeptidase/D-alanyl-D-alanine-endopeptidase [Bacteroidales bacterium]|nr:D-alanyl-D-alanine carboxypeptidase/D-alanyl-D-alanine-endopeptidase [Bacteroidales bacterium]
MTISRIITMAALLCAACFQSYAQNTARTSRKTSAQWYVDRKMKEEPFRSGLAGVLAVKMSGDTIAEYGSLRKLLPASNTKLITTGLAVRVLGPEYTYSTAIGYAGRLAGGVLHGDLYIVGGGDPTIASRDPEALPADSLFSCWKSIIENAGIQRIEGDIIGDGRYFDGPIENDSWSYGDLGTYYGAGCNGLSFHRNILNVNVMPGDRPGAPVKVTNLYPSLPWIEMRKTCITGPAGSGDNLYLFNTDLAPVAELRGSLAVDKGPRKEECSFKFGALACASYFLDYLRKNGVEVEGGAADVDSYGNIRTVRSLGERRDRQLRPAESVADMCIIGSVESPSLGVIAHTTNSRSDNFYAETLLRTIARERTGSASYDSCKVVIARELDSLDIDPSYGIQMVDGSGLARHNYISPDFFCRFLGAMAAQPCFRQYLATISSPGEAGMRSRLSAQPAELKSRIHMKSGSMNGVLCYSGYILPSSGKAEDTVVFSIMTNNCTGPSSPVLRCIDELIPLIAKGM